jgi:hypothetical protein
MGSKSTGKPLILTELIKTRAGLRGPLRIEGEEAAYPHCKLQQNFYDKKAPD